MVDGKLAEDILFVGSQIPMANAQGQRMLGVVKEIGDDTVKMDFNHPMAGKTLNFDVEVISVRDVTPEDLAGKCGCGGVRLRRRLPLRRRKIRRLRLPRLPLIDTRMQRPARRPAFLSPRRPAAIQ